MAETAFAILAGERVVLEASACHVVTPGKGVAGKLCSAALTDRRLILCEEFYDVLNGREREGPAHILHDMPLRLIASVGSDLTASEPSLTLELRAQRDSPSRLTIRFRDPGWHLGEPQRAAELERWREALEGARSVEATLPDPAPTAFVPVPQPVDVEGLVGGRYELGRRIGEGGMGLVFKGKDRQLDRPVAIKRMRPEFNLNERDRASFLKEARTSAALHHPFIVDIYEIVETPGRDVFLVFEFVEGETIAEVLERKGCMDPKEVSWALKDVCAALGHAHSQRYAHRDLKPSNIMLTPHGHAKVMDFGIARAIKDTISRLHTAEISGTMPYMAPEQELGRFSARSDIYSLGVTAYQMLTGELPFYGPDFFEQKKLMDWIPLSQCAPDAPRELAEAVERCMRFDPAERFETVEEFARAGGLPEAA